jgi:hypothetical protein
MGPGTSTASASAAAAAGGSSRVVGGYLAGLCQLLLQLLGACCCQEEVHSSTDQAQAASGTEATGQQHQQQQQQQVDVHKLALQLLAGTAALLLHWPAVKSQQERCTLAGLWRNCLLVNAQARGGSVGRAGLQAAVQQLLARMPGGTVGARDAAA